MHVLGTGARPKMRRLSTVLGVSLLLLVGVVAFAWLALQRVDWNEYKQPVESSVFEATGRRLDLGGNFSVRLGLRPALQVEEVAFENADWGSQEEMFTAERLRVRFELIPLLLGRLVVDRLEGLGVQVLLETRADGMRNWDFSGSGSDAPEASASEPSSTLLRAVQIENADIVIRDASGGRRHVYVERLGAEMSVPGRVDLILKGSTAEAAFALRGSVAGVEDLSVKGPLDLDLALEVGSTRAHLSGRVASPREGEGLELILDAAGDQLHDVASLAGQDWPDVGPYKLSLKLGGGGAAYSISDLAVAVGGSRIAGHVEVEVGEPRVRAEASLTSSRIDLSDFGSASAPEGEDPEPTSSQVTSARLFSPKPLPVVVLASSDVSVSLAIDTLVGGGVEASDVRLNVHLDASRLELESLGTQVAGGHVDLRVSLDASEGHPRLHGKANVRGVEAGQLALARGSDLVTGGPLDIDLEIAGRGASLRDIMASLDGQLELNMDKAVIQSALAGVAVADVHAAPAQALQGGGAKVSCLLADFPIVDGVARPNPLIADLGSVALIAKGKIDLRTEQIELDFDRRTRSLSVSELLPIFALRGDLADPRVHLGAAEIAGHVVDLGSALFAGIKRVVSPLPSGLGCRELYARLQRAESEWPAAPAAAIGTAIRRMGGAEEKEPDAVKRVLRGVEGLFGR